MDNAIFIAARGLPEMDWWSVYRLGTGQHLFDTYVPLVSFSISKQLLTPRYVGLDVPSDEVSESRLKQPNVVAVLTWASADRVLKEALLTCDDADQAALLRSYSDTTRSVSMVEGESVAATGKSRPREPSRTYHSTRTIHRHLIPSWYSFQCKATALTSRTRNFLRRCP